MGMTGTAGAVSCANQGGSMYARKLYAPFAAAVLALAATEIPAGGPGRR